MKSLDFLFKNSKGLKFNEIKIILNYYIFNLLLNNSINLCLETFNFILLNLQYKEIYPLVLKIIIFYKIKNNISLNSNDLFLIQSYLSFLFEFKEIKFDLIIENQLINLFGSNYENLISSEHLIITLNCNFPSILTYYEWCEIIIFLYFDLIHSNEYDQNLLNTINRFYLDIIKSINNFSMNSFYLLKIFIDNNSINNHLIQDLFINILNIIKNFLKNIKLFKILIFFLLFF